MPVYFQASLIVIHGNSDVAERSVDGLNGYGVKIHFGFRYYIGKACDGDYARKGTRSHISFFISFSVFPIRLSGSQTK